MSSSPEESQRPAAPVAPADGDAQVKISQDRLTATLIVTPPRGGGSMVLVPGAKQRLKAAGVTFGVDEDAIAQLLERCKRTGETVSGVVARGRKMVPEGPPRWEVNVNLSGHVDEEAAEKAAEAAAAGKGDKGKTDYHFVAPIPVVDEGQIIAVRNPGEPGQAGRTVLDQPIQPTPGKDEFPRPSSGITQTTDDKGRVQYIANMAGKIVVDGPRMYVSNEHVHQGDLTVASGDIVFPAHVTVRGHVLDNAVIKASGNVTVMGRVDSAFIDAGGTVSVSHGIVGGGRGKIVAAGAISANFAEGACVETRADAEIRRGIMNSDISASGSVIVLQGKGAIIGGTVRAGKSIEAKNIGSAASSETHLVVGTDFALLRERDELEASLEACQEIIRRLDHALGPLDLDSDLSKFPEDRRETVRTAVRERVRQRALLRTVESRLKDVRERIRDETGGVVKVMGNCFPGVKVTIGSSQMVVSEELRYCQILQKEDTLEIGTAPL